MSETINKESEMINENEASNAFLESAEPADRISATEELANEPEEATPLEADSDRSVGELDALRAEIGQLKELLAKKEEEQASAVRELDELYRLFPDLSLRDIPREVLERRERDQLPLYAAYAVYERERQLSLARADAVNQSNAARSAGRVGVDTASEYFSADEVKKMTPKQVHENFSKIRASMQSWARR